MRVGYARATLIASLAVALTFLLGTAQAFAATEVSLDPSEFGSELLIDDQTNDDDAITVSQDGTTITVTDTGTGGATAGTGCAGGGTTVTCPLDPPDPAPPAPPSAPVEFVELTMNDGTDSFTNQNLLADVDENDAGETGNKTVASGPGDDFTIETGSGNDFVDLGGGDNETETGAGNDTVVGGPEEDDVDPGTGDDVVDTGGGDDDIDEENASPDGADVLDGGPGSRDEIDYEGDAGVTIAINGQADDGHPGEGDNLLNLEELNGTGGNDVIAGSDAVEDISAGEGDDLITGAGGGDEISQGDGTDSVDGGDGGDEVFATSGGDEGDGADLLAGGPGGDRLDYCCADGVGVSVTPNGQADDGHPGEGDNVSGFEGLIGGSGPDTLVGDGSPNELVGLDGDDLLVGAGGNDEFFGDGGIFEDFEEFGDDTINALGGRDEVHCEFGFDTIAADAKDVVHPGCERDGAEIASESASVNRKGKTKVRVACPADEGSPCTGKLALLSNGKQIGKGKYAIANGAEKKVKTKLSKKGKKALAKNKGKLLVTAEARTQEPPGVTTNDAKVMLTRK
jgi:Ca2+-binding RTX toxin-like protein